MTKKPQTVKQLREFAIVMCLAFTVFGAISFWKWHYPTKMFMAMLTLTAVTMPLGLFAPRTLAVPERLWMAFAEKLGSVVTVLIMVLTYFVMVVPIGLLLRLIGKDLLALKLDRSQKSYWIPAEKNGPSSRPFLPY